MSSYTLHIQYVDRPAETRIFTQSKVTLGRDSGDIVLHDTQVSGRHGEISFEGGILRYTDVGSTNGSFLLQGQRVANIELTPGIALRLGNSLITVQLIDAPNVAGKGRTVIAGPGMAPGFPAPMRPPAGPPAPVSAVPPPGMPGAPAPSTTPPGGFAFAPTAQMQGPAMPGMPGMPPAPSGAFVPQPAPGFSGVPAPGFSGVPAPGFSGAPAPAPGFGPAPGFSGAPAPAPGFAPAPAFGGTPGPSVLPQPDPLTMPAAPSQSLQAPPGPPPGTFPGVPAAPESVGSASLAAVTPVTLREDSPDAMDGASADFNGVLEFVTGAWQALKPQIVPATIITGIVTVPMAVLGWFVLVTFGPFGFGGLLIMLLWVVQVAASLVVFPALMRFVIGVHLGHAPDVRAVITEQVADYKTVAPNFLLFGVVAGFATALFIVPVVFIGIFLGQIYFVEGKRYGDAFSRHLELAKPHWKATLLNVLVPVIIGAIGLVMVSWVFSMVPGVGGLLSMLASAVLQAVLMPIYMMLCTRMYFQCRRLNEGGDPEAAARPHLGVGALTQT